MVRFFRQLGLLLWKNGKLKSSCPWGIVITTTELLWPLLLFLVLGGLRQLFPSVQHNDSIYRPKALPSAGVLPFMQTLVCDLDDSSISYQSWINGSGAFPDMFPNAKINSIYRDLDGMIASDFDVDILCGYVHSFINVTNALLNPLPATVVGDFINDQSQFEEFLEEQYGVSPRVAQDLLNASVNIPAASLLLRDLPAGIGPGLPSLSPAILEHVLCNTSFLFTVITLPPQDSKTLQSDFCTPKNGTVNLYPLSRELVQELNYANILQLGSPVKTQDLLETAGELQSLVPLILKFQKTLSTFGTLTGDTGPNGTNSTMPEQLAEFFCGPGHDINMFEMFLFGLLTRDSHLDSKLHRNQQTHQKQFQLTGKFRPKIFYAPLNDLTTRIIKKANRTFSAVEDVLRSIKKAHECVYRLATAIPPGSDKAERLDKLMRWLVYGEGDPKVRGLSVSLLFGGTHPNLLGDLTAEEKEQLGGLFNERYPHNMWSVLYDVDLVLSNIEYYIDFVDWDVFHGVKSEEEMEDWAGSFSRVRAANYSYILAGLVFPDAVENATDLTIKIRMNTTYVHETDTIRNKVWYQDPERNAWKRRYFDAGFIFLQDMVERAAIEELTDKNITTPGVYIQEMPYPCYKRDRYVLSIQVLLPVVMTIAWLFTVSMTVRGVVREKESRLKEVMKMMGLSRLVHWLSWFITSGVILSISVLAMTAILYAFGILIHTNFFIVWAFLELYAVVVILFCFLMSLFFNNANLSASLSGLLYFLTVFLSITVWLEQGQTSAVVLAIPSLIAPVAFSIGIGYIAQFELQQVGLQFTNMMSSPIQEDHFSFFLAVVMLVVDALVYSILIWYIDAAFPGKYGTAKPWYFPFQLSFWLGKSRASRVKAFFTRRRAPLSVQAQDEDGLLDPLGSDSEDELFNDRFGNFEQCSSNLPVGIEIQNLVKVYSNCCYSRQGRGVLAVNNLSLDLYQDQITAFLGHNGAGKTTTMSILMGLFEPTSGTAYINGMDIRKDMDDIRRSLGICPQHNVLFDSLSVMDHVVFFGVLKGLSWKEARKEATEWLSKVGLEEFSKLKAKKLSGGMKRKLSILLAFVGNSKTIILDEPTSGVDPFARRQIWDFLSKSRKGRTIMLATHHMDEAEILGDRIAIISRGELLCCGSYFFLKKQFGKGHKLVVAMQRSRESIPVDQVDGCVQGITNFVSSLVPGAKLVEQNGVDLKYLLPLSTSGPYVLAGLFNNLDQHLRELRAESYGFTSCSLEEVFVRVTSANGDPDELSDDVPGDFPDGLPPPEDPSQDRSKDGITTDDANQRDLSDGQLSPNVPSAAVEEADDVFSEDLQEEDSLLESEAKPNRGLSLLLLLHQLWALILKRLQYSRHRYIFILVLNFLPLVVTLLSLSVTRFLSSVPDPVPFDFSNAQYTSTGFDNYMVVGGPSTPDTCKYFDSLYHPCGIGADDVGSSLDRASKCYWPQLHFSTCNSTIPEEFTGPCTAESPILLPEDCGSHNRPLYAPRPSPASPRCYSPQRTQPGGHTFIQDLRYGPRTSYDTDVTNETAYGDKIVTDYLLWSTGKYIQNRYGGVVMGVTRDEIPALVDQMYQNTSKAYLAVRQSAKALFSYKGYHSMPTYLNVLNNALLRANVKGDPFVYGVKTFSHPFATTTLQKLEKAIESMSFVVNPLGMMFALSFLVCGYCVLLIEERTHKFLHLQEVAGLNKFVYWISAYIWDSIGYTLFVLISLGLFLAFQDPNFTSPEVFPYFALIMFLFGHALIPWVYTFSLLFSSSTTAFIVLFCFYFFGGFALMIINTVVYFIIDEDSYGVYLLFYITPPLPTYALSRAFGYLTFDYLEKVLNLTLNPFADSVSVGGDLWPYIVALIVYAVYGWFMLMLSVYVIIPWVLPLLTWCWRGHSDSVVEMSLDINDDDVARERQRVLEGDTTRDVLVTRDISKSYFGHSRFAVNNVSFGVKKGECFGLLGVNGAGKTSTFKMLTGDLTPSTGSALVNGFDIRTKLSSARSEIGYCPQFDGLLDSLSGRQHLELFARLRGYHGQRLQEMVENTLTQLQLMEYGGRVVSAYSGGNKRKLSTAISLLAQPKIVLLDEPTAGVDPEARRFLWKVIQEVVGCGQSVLLTTHSMAECEVLCSRVAIMVNGRLMCLGSPQHLKEKFGSGYRIKLHMTSDVLSLEPMKEFVRQNFEGAELKEEHHNVLVYQWNPHPGGLGSVYTLLTDCKERMNLEEFSVSQTTLDDVFIHFANQQSDVSDLEDTSRPLPDIVSSTSGIAMSMLYSTEEV